MRERARPQHGRLLLVVQVLLVAPAAEVQRHLPPLACGGAEGQAFGGEKGTARCFQDTNSLQLTGRLESVVEVVPVAPEGGDADAGGHQEDGQTRVLRQAEVRRPWERKGALVSRLKPIKECNYQRKQVSDRPITEGEIQRYTSMNICLYICIYAFLLACQCVRPSLVINSILRQRFSSFTSSFILLPPLSSSSRFLSSHFLSTFSRFLSTSHFLSIFSRFLSSHIVKTIPLSLNTFPFLKTYLLVNTSSVSPALSPFKKPEVRPRWTGPSPPAGEGGFVRGGKGARGLIEATDGAALV